MSSQPPSVGCISIGATAYPKRIPGRSGYLLLTCANHAPALGRDETRQLLTSRQKPVGRRRRRTNLQDGYSSVGDAEGHERPEISRCYRRIFTTDGVELGQA